MNLLADESIDRPIVVRLRQEGHIVRYIAELEPGISDDKVLEIANNEAAPLLTADKDFGELVYRHHRGLDQEKLVTSRLRVGYVQT
jgi:predicted nuclease of predicted toxin-antitoxin system